MSARRCPKGKVWNRETNRCRNPCASDQVRDPFTKRCVSRTYLKNLDEGKIPCTRPMRRNPKTGRCKQPCASGYVVNPATGRKYLQGSDRRTVYVDEDGDTDDYEYEYEPLGDDVSEEDFDEFASDHDNVSDDEGGYYYGYTTPRPPIQGSAGWVNPAPQASKTPVPALVPNVSQEPQTITDHDVRTMVNLFSRKDMRSPAGVYLPSQGRLPQFENLNRDGTDNPLRQAIVQGKKIVANFDNPDDPYIMPTVDDIMDLMFFAVQTEKPIDWFLGSSGRPTLVRVWVSNDPQNLLTFVDSQSDLKRNIIHVMEQYGMVEGKNVESKETWKNCIQELDNRMSPLCRIQIVEYSPPPYRDPPPSYETPNVVSTSYRDN